MTSFGKYQLVKKLAAGGMGEVFLARAEGAGGFEKLLVLKRILPHLAENKEFLDLFLDEARIAARLNHANVVQIFELGDVNGAWYLVMEYVPGKDLRQVTLALKHRRRLMPLGFACRIAADAAAGLDYAHRARDAQGRPLQIIHRDVSPHNVLLSFDGAVKLIDFGVAKAANRIQHTEGAILRGKYPYMSPEQVTSGELDHTSDQFSLGVVLWEVLTGQRLFKADNDPMTLEKVAQCVVPPPSRKDGPLPPQLVALVMRALQKNPEKRFADLAAFRLELEDLITAQQLQASNAHLATFMGGLFPDGAEGVTASEPDAAPTRSQPRVLPAMLRPVGPVTSFIGRTAELKALRALTSERLLTLTGPAGIGKSRLATQLAIEQTHATLADLSGVSDLPGLHAEVARVLCVPLAPERANEALALRPGLMLVLDGLLPFAFHTVDAWRRAAPEVTFVVTSREPLNVPGERVWEVPPLAEAAELCRERAPAGTEAVADRVQRLGGSPLAIELIAPRSPTQPAEPVSLAQAIAWSWSQLQGHEQLAMSQLAVIDGRFSLEAAEAVVSLSAFLGAPWALDVVQVLRTAGLLGAWDVGGELRFGLHPSVRAHALDKLDPADQAKARFTAWKRTTAR